MTSLLKKQPRPRPQRGRVNYRRGVSAAGIYLGLAGLAMYSQLLWAAHNGYAHITARLAGAALVGGMVAWLLTRMVGWLARRRGEDEEPALRRWSYCLAPVVLILLTPLYHGFLSIALLSPPLIFLAQALYRRLRQHGMRFVKHALANLALCLLSLALALALGELWIYILYHDFPSTTHRSPNPHYIVHTKNPHHRPQFSPRGPGSSGPKPPGVKRILVQGDSITTGAQSDWRKGITNQLLNILNQRQPGRWQMDVIAKAGHEIDHHCKDLRKLGAITKPDVIVYIWYVNDLEVDKELRPTSKMAVWRNLPFHHFLRRYSYLYRFLDIRLADALPRLAPTYIQYLAHNYRSGTYHWLVFELLFHSWLDRATSIAPRTIVYLYPTLPRRGLGSQPYPLRHLHQQVIRAAGAEDISYPAWMTPHQKGVDQRDGSSPYGVIRLARRGTAPGSIVVDGPLPHWLAITAGHYRADFRLKIASSSGDAPVARLQVTDGQGHVLSRKDVPAGNNQGRWHKVALPFTVGPAGVKDLRLQVEYLRGGDLAVDQVILHWPLHGRVQVVDGLPQLRNLKTWQNQFDGHPNAKTNQIVAQTLARAVLTPDMGLVVP